VEVDSPKIVGLSVVSHPVLAVILLPGSCYCSTPTLLVGSIRRRLVALWWNHLNFTRYSRLQLCFPSSWFLPATLRMFRINPALSYSEAVPVSPSLSCSVTSSRMPCPVGGPSLPLLLNGVTVRSPHSSVRLSALMS
jgi:hypothetical protein